MKKIICLIFTLLFIAIPAKAKNVKFMQVTDVHMTKSNSEYLAQFVEDVNAKYKDLDFIVFTGDNIDKTNPQDLEDFLNIVKKLNVKTYILPGNHDLFRSHNITKESYMKLVKKKLGPYHSSKTNYVIKQGNIIFLTMNGVKEVIPGANGYYKQEELDWLDKMLYKHSDKKVVILQHFPLLETNVRSHKLYKKEPYEEILKKHNNVISIISGHYHENREERENGIYHIITKNFSNNTYYKIIEIDEDCDMVFTSLIDNSGNSQ